MDEADYDPRDYVYLDSNILNKLNEIIVLLNAPSLVKTAPCPFQATSSIQPGFPALARPLLGYVRRLLVDPSRPDA
jgi:hypothetical protein